MNSRQIPQQKVEQLRQLAYWLDESFRIPGTGIRLGFDSLLGLIPGIGDLAGGALSAYIIVEARRLGVPRRRLARMVGHLALDVTIGAIPLVGDVFDVAWKANRRNLRLLLEHLESQG